MNHIHDFTEEQKEAVTKWVNENSEFDRGDLVTVDYVGEGIPFANSEYGGVPLRVKKPTWRGVHRVSPSGLYRYHEDGDMDMLLKLYEEDDAPKPEKYGWTPYVKPKIEYNLEVAVSGDMECHRSIEQAALVLWEDYEGDLQLSLRDDRSTVSVREGEECVVCGFSAERVAESSLPDGTPYGRTECAVCGYVKSEDGP